MDAYCSGNSWYLPLNNPYAVVRLPKEGDYFHFYHGQVLRFATKSLEGLTQYAQYEFGYRGKGKALFKIEHDFYRGRINADEVAQCNEPIDCLGRDVLSHIDPHSTLLQDQALRIYGQLPSVKRRNPYYLAEAVLDWVYSNINYVDMNDMHAYHLALTMARLPTSERTPLNILKKYYGLADEEALRIAEHIDVPDAVSRCIDISRAIYDQGFAAADKLGMDALQLFLLGDLPSESMHDRTILQTRRGKCDAYAKLYVSLCRALGIPSTECGGYYYGSSSYQDLHGWAASLFHPYGWREVDPSHGLFREIPFERYFYEVGSTQGLLSAYTNQYQARVKYTIS